MVKNARNSLFSKKSFFSVLTSLSLLAFSSSLLYFSINNSNYVSGQHDNQVVVQKDNPSDFTPQHQLSKDAQLENILQNSVSIHVYQYVENDFNYEDYSDDDGDCCDGCSNSEMIAKTMIANKFGSRMGSGVVLYLEKHKKFVILTCKHLFVDENVTDVKELEKIKEDFNNGKSYVMCIKNNRGHDNEVSEVKFKLKVIEISPDYDLSLLEFSNDFSENDINKFFNKKLTLDMSEEEAYGVGSELMHVGSFFAVLTHSFSYGHVSSMYRTINVIGYGENILDQADMSTYHGSSGGPVFLKENGKLVGVLVAGNSFGISFFVPLRHIVKFMTKLNLN